MTYSQRKEFCTKCELKFPELFLADVYYQGRITYLCPSCVIWWAQLPEQRTAIARAEGRLYRVRREQLEP